MKLATLLVLVPMSAGVAMAETPTVVDALALANRSNAAWSDSLTNGEQNAVAASYATDAIVVTPDGVPLTGNAAISGYWASRLADRQQNYLRAEAAEFRGDLLVESGAWGASVPDATGKPAYRVGNFIRILAKQDDGSWKIRMESWNPGMVEPRSSLSMQ